MDVDQEGDVNEDKFEQWKKDVLKVCSANTKKSAETESVCDWTTPCATIVNKSLGPDGYELGEGIATSSSNLFYFCAVALVGVVYWYGSKFYYDAMRNVLDED